MPYRPATRRSANCVQATFRDPNGVVSPGGRLMAAEGEAVRLPAVQPKPALAVADGALEQRLMDGHVLEAGATVEIDPEIPSSFRLLRPLRPLRPHEYSSIGGHTHIRFRSP